MKSVVIQKAFVLNGDGQFLAIKRSETDVRRPLEWDLPGGWLDEGETLEHGVIREVKEETGLDATDPHLLFTKTEIRTWQEGTDANKQGNCVFLFYFVHTTQTSTVTLSSEHVDFTWMTFEEALQAFEYPLHKSVIEHIVHNKLLQP